MDWSEEKVDQMIRKTARTCYQMLPQSARVVHSIEDLVQEGELVDHLCRTYYNKSSGVKYPRMLWVCLICRYRMILRTEYQQKRRGKILHDYDPDRMGGLVDANNPERLMIVAEMIEAVGEFSQELKSLIIDGVPDRLVQVARTAMRLRHYKLGRIDHVVGGKIRVTKIMIEDYFGISLRKISKFVRKGLL